MRLRLMATNNPNTTEGLETREILRQYVSFRRAFRFIDVSIQKLNEIDVKATKPSCFRVQECRPSFGNFRPLPVSITNCGTVGVCCLTVFLLCRLTVLFIVGGTLVINRLRRNGMRKEKQRTRGESPGRRRNSVNDLHISRVIAAFGDLFAVSIDTER